MIFQFSANFTSMLKSLVFLFCIVPIAFASFACDTGTLDDLCMVTKSRILTSSTTLSGDGSLILATTDGRGLWCSASKCVITITMGEIVTVYGNSSIKAPVINVKARNITIDSLGSISTDGMGQNAAGKGKSSGDGGGHGGNGASCINAATDPDGGSAYGLLTLRAPKDAGSPGAGPHPGGGGGVISIDCNNTLLLRGTISCGGSAGDKDSGGGSGGSIVVYADRITGSGVLSARGAEGYSGGGGGRIALYVPTVTAAATLVSGGSSKAADCSYGGGGGTLWVDSSSQTSLHIDNDNISNDKAAYTPICDTRTLNPSNLFVTNFAALRPPAKASLFATNSLTVASATVYCEDSYSISSASVMFLYDGTIIASDKDLTIEANSTITIPEHVTLSALGSIYITGNSLGVIGTVSSADMLSVTKVQTFGVAGTVSSTRILVDTGDLNILSGGRIQNENSNCSSDYGPLLSCSMSPASLFDNGINSVFNVAGGFSMEMNSQLYGGTIVLCVAGHAYLPWQAVISSSGGGCSENRGIGSGGAAPSAPGGGGGHGGAGGKGKLWEQASDGGIVYDSANHPTNTGSGGGDPGGGGGSGGGVIYFEAGTIDHSGVIISNGLSGGGPSIGNPGGGGGSGGTLTLVTSSLVGNGLISACGGSGGESGGGGGGGGIIRFDWQFGPVFSPPANFTGVIAVSGGRGDTSGGGSGKSGGVGKKTALPCPPGYGTVLCNGCEKGTYKSKDGTDVCTLCTNAPQFGQYINREEKSPNCAYKCPKGLIMPNCLTPFQYLVSLVGGPAGFIGCVSGAVILLLAPYFVKRWREQSSSIKVEDLAEPLLGGYEEGQPRYTTAIHHLVESSTLNEGDLGKHLHRIYFHGTNTPYDAWHTDYAPPEVVAKDVHLEAYAQFAAWCNYHCQWSRRDRVIYIVLWMFAGPLLGDWLHKKRDAKFQRLRYYVQIEYDYAFLRSFRARAMLNCLRCNATADRTLGFVDILEYSETEERDGKPCIPTVLLFGGSGSYSEPFWLSESDPLTTTIGNYEHRDRSMWLVFIAALNARLRSVSKHALTTTLKPVFELLQYHNKRHFISAPLPFQLHLGKFQQTDTGRFQLGLAAVEPSRMRSITAVIAPIDDEPSINKTPRELYESEQEASAAWPDGFKRHRLLEEPIPEPAVAVISLPYQGTLIEPVLPMKRFSFAMLWSLPTTIFYYITHSLSFAVAAYGNVFIWGVLTTLALIAEIGFVFFTLYEFLEVDPVGFAISVSVMPVFIVLAPILGICAILFPKTQYDLPRKFVVANMVASINAAVTLLYAVIIWPNVNWKSWAFTPIALLVNKFLLAVLMNFYLANFEVAVSGFYHREFDAFARRRSTSSRRHTETAAVTIVRKESEDEAAVGTYDGVSFPRASTGAQITGFSSISSAFAPPASSALLDDDSPPSSPRKPMESGIG